MDEIISLEKKIDHALEKIKFNLIENRKTPNQAEETRLDAKDKVKRLEEENERLAKELAEVRGEVLSEEADRELLERLLGEIDVPYADLETVVARILGTPPGNFGSHLVEIDKGSDDGLSEAMPVVTGAGLVGRLEQVDS